MRQISIILLGCVVVGVIIVGWGEYHRIESIEDRSVRSALTVVGTLLLLSVDVGIVYVLVRISIRDLLIRPSCTTVDLSHIAKQSIIHRGQFKQLMKGVFALSILLFAVLVGFVPSLVERDLRYWLYGSDKPSEAFAALYLATSVVRYLMIPILSLFAFRLLTHCGERNLRTDSRPPFVYLRSFAADVTWKYDRFEQKLAMALADIGPLVAIGHPNELLPPLGAARVYVRGNEWKDVVSELIGASRAVLLRMGNTKGFWWEFKHVVSKCDPHKVIVCLPCGRWSEDSAQWRAWRERANEFLPRDLPQVCGDARFLVFDTGWKPILLHADTSHWLRQFIVGEAPKLRDMLNEPLKRLDIPTRQMSLIFAEYLCICLLLAVVNVYFFFGRRA